MITNQEEKISKDKLIKFVRDVHWLLGFLVENSKLFYSKELQEEIFYAWNEFSDDFDLKETEELISNIPANKLIDSGLYGYQLKLKLIAFNNRLEILKLDWSKLKYLTKFVNGRKFKKTLHKILDAAGIILISMIPISGLKESLREIKEILENLFKDTF